MTSVREESERHEQGDQDTFPEEREDKATKQDLQQFGIYRALPVYGDPDFSSGPPQSAEEYIRRVRYEAAQLPDVVMSSIDPRHYDEARTAYSGMAACDIPSAEPWAVPAWSWVSDTLHDFVAVRNDLLRCEHAQDFDAVEVPSENDHRTWRTFCLGSVPAAPTDCNPPTLPVLMAIDQVNCNYLLAWHTRWAIESQTLSDQSSRWLYAIMARLQRPLTQGAMGALRAMLRHCASLRAAATSAEDPSLPSLNILIAITGAFFGQDETLAGCWEEAAE